MKAPKKVAGKERVDELITRSNRSKKNVVIIIYDFNGKVGKEFAQDWQRLKKNLPGICTAIADRLIYRKWTVC